MAAVAPKGVVPIPSETDLHDDNWQVQQIDEENLKSKENADSNSILPVTNSSNGTRMTELQVASTRMSSTVGMLHFK